MRGVRTIAWVLGAALLVGLAAGPAAAFEPVQLDNDWIAKVEAELTVASELRLSYDFNAGSSHQPFTKRRGGFFETYGLVAAEVSRQDESVKLRAAMGFFGLADPGNRDIGTLYEGDNGYYGDLSIEEAWGQIALGEGSWVRLGIQKFNSDHAGLVYNDSDRGVVLHTTIGGMGVNLAGFVKSFDDKFSQLNTENGRPWYVFVANMEIPIGDGDTVKLQMIPSVHVSLDRTGMTDTDVVYLGVSTAGMVGGLQTICAAYVAMGEQQGGIVNPADQTIEAFQVLVDVGLPLMEGKVFPHVGFFMGSGDDDPLDDRARGFDAIYDNVSAWGYNHFVIKNRINLGPGSLARANSGLFAFRDFDEPANFVNPGIAAFNVGVTTKCTDAFTVDFNIGPAFLPHPDVPQLVLGRSVAEEIGWAINTNATWAVSDTVTIVGGVAAFIPSAGAQDIFGGNTTALNACIMMKIKV